jgi:hypothetical protein
VLRAVFFFTTALKLVLFESVAINCCSPAAEALVLAANEEAVVLDSATPITPVKPEVRRWSARATAAGEAPAFAEVLPSAKILDTTTGLRAAAGATASVTVTVLEAFNTVPVPFAAVVLLAQTAVLLLQ